MSELAEGARLEIVCVVNSGTEGSNPSLSAINFCICPPLFPTSVFSRPPFLPPDGRTREIVGCHPSVHGIHLGGKSAFKGANIKGAPFRPTSVLGDGFNPRHTIRMPPVEMIARLDLDRTETFKNRPKEKLK